MKTIEEGGWVGGCKIPQQSWIGKWVYIYSNQATSPSKDQHSDGLHVTSAKNIENDGQPNMHTDLERPKLK